MSADAAIRRIIEGAIRSEPPVIEHQCEVTVDLDPFGLADDQDPIEPAGRLLAAISRWVVPERAGVGRTETIIEARARSDWRLRKMWHPVHVIRQPHAMPVHGRRLLQVIEDAHAQFFAPPHPQRRPGYRVAIGPNRGRSLCLAPQRRGAVARAQDVKAGRPELRPRPIWKTEAGNADSGPREKPAASVELASPGHSRTPQT